MGMVGRISFLAKGIYGCDFTMKRILHLNWLPLIDLPLNNNNIPNFPAVALGAQESSTEQFSVLAFASSIIARNFFHCAFALSVTSHCFEMY